MPNDQTRQVSLFLDIYSQLWASNLLNWPGIDLIPLTACRLGTPVDDFLLPLNPTVLLLKSLTVVMDVPTRGEAA